MTTKKNELRDKLNGLAKNILLDQILNPDRYGLVYRKDKSSKNVQVAVQKALKNGMGKTETEIAMLELQLEKIFKLER